MVQLFRVFTTLADDKCSKYIRWLINIYHSSSRGSDDLSWPLRAPTHIDACNYIGTQTPIHTHT